MHATRVRVYARKRLHAGARAVQGSLAVAARHASTSSSSRESLEPALATGWHARWGSIERNLVRLPRFAMYLQNDYFAPSLSIVHHAILYSALNAPQQVDLDLDEFLIGAEAATKSAIQDIYSRDFARYLAEGKSSSRVERMQSYCLPSCFHRLQNCTKQAFANGVREAISVEVDSVHLTRVIYDRLPENGVATGVDTLEPKISMGGEDVPASEHLQLQVEVRTSERMRQVDAVRGQTSELFQRNVYVVRLASNVTSTKEIDWRLAMIAIRTKGKAYACTVF